MTTQKILNEQMIALISQLWSREQLPMIAVNVENTQLLIITLTTSSEDDRSRKFRYMNDTTVARSSFDRTVEIYHDDCL